MSKEFHRKIKEVVTKGWCYPKTEKKEIDVDLVEAISLEVNSLFYKTQTDNDRLKTKLDEVEASLRIARKQKANLWVNSHKADTKIEKLQKRIRLLVGVLQPAYQYLEDGGRIECGSTAHGEFEQVLKGDE